MKNSPTFALVLALLQPAPLAAQSGGLSGFSIEAGCDAVLLPDVPRFPAMAPLKQDISPRIDLTVAPDGSITAARIGDSSGDAGLDAALLAHVQKNWRYRPLAKGCPSLRLQTRLHLPHVTCAPLPLVESQTAPDTVEIQDRPRSVTLAVGVAPDGAVLSTSVTRSSGDAGLDAAAMAHVKAAWRWQPYVCNGRDGKPLAQVMGAATVNFPYEVPDPPAR